MGIVIKVEKDWHGVRLQFKVAMHSQLCQLCGWPKSAIT